MTTPLTVGLYPIWAGGSRGYVYDVALDGECIASRSRDPEIDLARALVARGIKGVVTVIDARTGKPRSKVVIEKAVSLRTVETGGTPRFRKVTCADEAYTGEILLPVASKAPSGFGPAGSVEPDYPQKKYPEAA